MAKGHSPLPLLTTLLVLAGGIVLWEWSVAVGRVDPFFFSRPSLVAQDFGKLFTDGIAAKHLTITLKEAGIGFLFGGVLGTATGMLLGRFRGASAAVMPLLVGLNGLPKLALAPLLIFWLGIGLGAKALLAGAMVYFIFTFNLYAGYLAVDSQLADTVRLLGGSRWQILRKVVWPACLPWFLTSLRSSVGIAMSGAIVGEYIGSSKGWGWLINNASGSYQITRVLSCLLVIVLIVVVLDCLIRLLERMLLKWRP